MRTLSWRLSFVGIVCLSWLPGLMASEMSATASALSGAGGAGSAWEGLDLEPLTREIRLRGLAPDDRESSRIAASNLRFILENKINKGRFLVQPSPQEVLEDVVQILCLNNEIRDLVRHGRSILHHNGENEALFLSDSRRLMRRLTSTADTLQTVFRRTFVELQLASVEVSIVKDDARASFSFYLVQVDRLNRRLTERLNEYFLNPSPGSVSVPDFSNSSIAVLAEGIIRLGQINRVR